MNPSTLPARRLGVEVMAKPFIVTAATVHVSGSIGVVLATASVKMDPLKQQADMALYQAKRAGRNCVVFHGDDAGAPQSAACPSTK